MISSWIFNCQLKAVIFKLILTNLVLIKIIRYIFYLFIIFELFQLGRKQ